MATTDIKLNFSDETLFGNDAAEDEEHEVFESYFVERPEIMEFLSESRKIRVLRAYRGEGKSAILRRIFSTLQNQNAIVCHTTGSSLAPKISTTDSDLLTREWKKNIFSLIANEIGAQINLAWDDDSISLVEEAENNNFKSRSLVSSIVDRLKKSPIPIHTEKKSISNPEKVIQRWMNNKPLMWVIIDDIDENFQNLIETKTKIAAFFSACRSITNLVPHIRIRTGIRPNVWTIIRQDFESLSKVDQYVLDLRWDAGQMRSILAKRIEGYLKRTNNNKAFQLICNYTGVHREENLINYAFEESMAWGYNKFNHKRSYRAPHVVMTTLSSNRPRWMIELARASANRAKLQNKSQITVNCISQELAEFGRTRISDLSAEYLSICPQIKDIINSFANQNEDFKTDELNKIINTRILPHLDISISGVTRKINSLDISALLYEIGFLTARQELEDKSYKHYMFADSPYLLHNKTNIDHGLSWEIHPVFRQALNMRDSDGKRIFHDKQVNPWD